VTRLRAVARHYLPPGTKGRFVLGCDPSEGVEGGNPCAVVVIRAEDWNVAAVLDGWLAPHRLALAIASLAMLYAKGDVGGKPIVAIENNTFGIAVLQELRGSQLNLYGSYIASRNDFKLGFPTYHSSRDNAIEQMRLAGEKWGIAIHDRKLWEQVRPGNLIYSEEGKMGTADGPDDLAIALAIACSVRAEKYGDKPIAVPTDAAPPVIVRDRSSWIWEEEAQRVKSLETDAAEPEWVAYA
jgi:hypothetical protein